MHSAIAIITALSVLVQAAAVILALSLIRVSGGRRAWVLISLGISGMAIRRVTSLAEIFLGESTRPVDLGFEALGLATSLFMLAGIAWIAPLFRKIRESEEAVRRSEERYRTIVDTAQEGIMLLDADGKIRFVNGSLAAMFGYGEQEMIGRPFVDFIDDSAKFQGRECFERCRGGKRVQDDFFFRTRAGAQLWGIVSGSPLFENGGCFTGALATITDITDRKRSEEERDRLIAELRDAAARVRTLSGLLPICSSCKRIRDDKGYWNQLEEYIRDHSGAEFTHGLCPECLKRLLRGMEL